MATLQDVMPKSWKAHPSNTLKESLVMKRRHRLAAGLRRQSEWSGSSRMRHHHPRVAMGAICSVFAHAAIIRIGHFGDPRW